MSILWFFWCCGYVKDIHNIIIIIGAIGRQEPLKYKSTVEKYSKMLARKIKTGVSSFKLVQATYVTKGPKPEIPKNVIGEVYSSSKQKDNGIIYDKKPFKLTLEEGKNYTWCLCGRSKSQPLCDGTHRDVYLKITQRPIRFKVEKTKEYWLCNCKQTKNRPFCDGTHKQKEIQEATSIRV